MVPLIEDVAMPLVVGVDFDNTLIRYDELLHRAAMEQLLIAQSVGQTKRAVRDEVRRLPDGEAAWQRLQAIVYGPQIMGAPPADGMERFFRVCQARRVPIHIVSHKTAQTAGAPTIDLRAAALGWMRAHRFFEADGLGLSEGHVHFEPTRADKLQRIQALRCSHFVDDLEETFREPTFPADVEKILFDPHRQAGVLPGVRVVSTWDAIRDHIFDDTR